MNRFDIGRYHYLWRFAQLVFVCYMVTTFSWVWIAQSPYEGDLNELYSTKEVGGVRRELHGSTPSSKWKILYLVFDPRQRLPGGESLLLGLGRQCHSARAVALTEPEGLRHCRALLYFRQNGYMKRARSLTSLASKQGKSWTPENSRQYILY